MLCCMAAVVRDCDGCRERQRTSCVSGGDLTSRMAKDCIRVNAEDGAQDIHQTDLYGGADWQRELRLLYAALLWAPEQLIYSSNG
jgi:hypothetical protein